MLWDKFALFSEDQTVAANAASTNMIDLRSTALAPPARIALQIGAVSGTSPTLKADLQLADDTAFTENLLTVGSSGVRSGLELGNIVEVPLNPAAGGQRRKYARLYYTVGGSDPSFVVARGGIVADIDMANPLVY
jgi:hypothetical protein